MRAATTWLIMLVILVSNVNAQSNNDAGDGEIPAEFLRAAGLSALLEESNLRRSESVTESARPASTARETGRHDSDLEDAHAGMKTVTVTLEELRQRSEAAEQRVRKTVEATKAALTRLVAIQQGLVKAQADVAAANSVASEASQSLENTRDEVERLRHHLDSQKKELELSIRRAELEQLAAAVERTTAIVTSARSELASAMQELLEESAAAGVANQLVSTTKDRITKLSQKSDEMSNVIVQQTKLIELLTQTRTKLQQAAVALDDADVATAAAGLQILMKKKRQANSLLRKALAGKIVELEDMKQRLHDAKHETGKQAKSMSAVQQRVNELSDVLRAAEKQHSDARNAAEQAATAFEQAARQLSKSTASRPAGLPVVRVRSNDSSTQRP